MGDDQKDVSGAYHMVLNYTRYDKLRLHLSDHHPF